MSVLRAIFNFFYEIFFGCSHERQTRPFTLQHETYKVCLDCGAQIFYSPDNMRPLNSRELKRMRAAHAGELKVISQSAQVSPLAATGGNKSSAA
jgi:hypothetical protein